MAWMSLGTFGCAAAANTLNQVYEVANDALMKRTMRRPLPTGRVSRLHALLFASAAGAAGVAVLYYKARRCARPPSAAPSCWTQPADCAEAALSTLFSGAGPSAGSRVKTGCCLFWCCARAQIAKRGRKLLPPAAHASARLLYVGVNSSAIGQPSMCRGARRTACGLRLPAALAPA